MIDVNYNEYKETIAENMELIQKNHKLKEEIERLTKKLDKEKSKNKKVFKIVDDAMTEQMITGEATINLLELYAILKGK